MAKYRMNIRFKTHYGTNSVFCEVELPNHLDSKIGNSNYKQEIVAALSAVLPQNINGADWRKQGHTVLDFPSYQKL